MTVLPFRPPGGQRSRKADRAPSDPLCPTDVANVDDVGEYENLDDLDESMLRFQSFDRSKPLAHHTLSPTLFATLTGVPLTWCQPFHLVLFTLLQDVGDFDGLIATPTLLIGASDARLDSADAWLRDHPAPDIEAMIEAAKSDDYFTNTDVDEDITDAVDAHSLALAVAADSNPSLTFGCRDSFLDRLTDKILEIELSCRVDHMSTLTAAAVSALHLLAGSARFVGGVTMRQIEAE